MNIIKTSFALKLLDKLDIRENSRLVQSVKESFIINKLACLLEFIQKKLCVFGKTSMLIKNIDFIILSLLSLLVIIIPIASTGLIGAVVVVAFLATVLKYCCVEGERHFISSFDIPVFLYIVIAGLSVTFSSLFIQSLAGYVKMLVYFGGYLAFLHIFRNNPKKIVYMMAFVAGVASIEAFYAIYQQIVGVEALAAWQDLSEVNPEQLMNRVYGTLKPFNPNLLAGYLIASFSSALGVTFLFLNRKKWGLSLISFIGMSSILLAIIFTGSRGAYIAIAIMSILLVIISGHLVCHDFGHVKWLKKLWIAGIVLGIVMIVIMVLFSPSIQHRILSIFIFREDSSNSYRFNVYSACVKIFADNWLTGIGAGNTTFRLIYGLYMITGFDALGAYSVPLEIAIESGIIGLLVFLWLILFVFVKGVKYIHSKNLPENKIIVSSCLIGISGLMAHGMVDTIWYRPQVNIIFWMLIAILAVVLTRCDNQKSSSIDTC